MKVSVESPSETSKSLKIEVSAEKIDVFIDKELNRVRKKVQLPGFRKGKAPREIVSAQYGQQIQAAAIENAIQENYSQVVNDENLNPVGPANIADMSYEPGKPLKFTAQIEIEPEFTIGKLKGMRVEKEEPDVTPEIIENALKQIQLRFGTVRTKEGAAESGDRLLVDIEEIDPATGVALIGKSYPGKSLRIGDQVYGPEFDEQLTGIKQGDKRRIVQQAEQYVLTAPQDRHQHNQPETHFLVTAKKIEAVDLPEINDALAQEMKFETVDVLRENVKIDLAAQLNNAARERLKNALEKEVVRIVDPPVPQAMVERYLDNLIENLMKMSDTSQDTEKLRAEGKDLARQKVRWYLIRQKLMGEENISVSDGEIDEYIDTYAKNNNLENKRVHAEYRSGKKRDDLKSALLDDKIYDFLENKADVRTVPGR